jgi:hypothetical protein
MKLVVPAGVACLNKSPVEEEIGYFSCLWKFSYLLHIKKIIKKESSRAMVRLEGLGKLKNPLHRDSKARPSGL